MKDRLKVGLVATIVLASVVSSAAGPGRDVALKICLQDSRLTDGQIVQCHQRLSVEFPGWR